MQKLAELSSENPDWEEKCKLENLRWSEIANFTKAMWRNITRNLMDIKSMKCSTVCQRPFTITVYLKNILDALGNKVFCIFFINFVLLICFIFLQGSEKRYE